MDGLQYKLGAYGTLKYNKHSSAVRIHMDSRCVNYLLVSYFITEHPVMCNPVDYYRDYVIRLRLRVVIVIVIAKKNEKVIVLVIVIDKKLKKCTW